LEGPAGGSNFNIDVDVLAFQRLGPINSDSQFDIRASACGNHSRGQCDKERKSDQ
jgi:hypothetical protein